MSGGKILIIALAAIGVAAGAAGFYIGGQTPTEAAAPQRAGEPIELTWRDLIPGGGAPATPDFSAPDADMSQAEQSAGLRGTITHGVAALNTLEVVEGLVTKYNDQTIAMPGYIVPLDFDGEVTSKFLLVPFIGACVHVPPPPPNQIVYVEVADPYPIQQLFEAVTVTGVFSSSVETTELAEVGYKIVSAAAEPL